jgi:hypothetical protein
MGPIAEAKRRLRVDFTAAGALRRILISARAAAGARISSPAAERKQAAERLNPKFNENQL